MSLSNSENNRKFSFSYYLPLSFCLIFFSDILCSLFIQCTLCKWAEHFGQSESSNPRVPRYEWQPGVVAGWGWRTAGLCTFQLHPQVRVHLSIIAVWEAEIYPATTTNKLSCRSTWKKGQCCAFTLWEMGWWGEWENWSLLLLGIKCDSTWLHLLTFFYIQFWTFTSDLHIVAFLKSN